MGWDWGWPVRMCRFWHPDFCTFCVVINRAWHQLILHRNPTFIGWQPPPDTHDPEDANYI